MRFLAGSSMPEPESLCRHRLILPASQSRIGRKTVDGWQNIAITLMDPDCDPPILNLCQRLLRELLRNRHRS